MLLDLGIGKRSQHRMQLSLICRFFRRTIHVACFQWVVYQQKESRMKGTALA